MPALRGRRVELRALREADAADLFEAVSASYDELKRRLRWATSVKSQADCLEFIRSCLARAGRGDSLAFAVVEIKKGRLAGVAALQGMLETPGLAEASLWIRTDWQGKGYALEAGKLLAAHAVKNKDVQRIYARIDPGNRAARKVLKKLGFRYEGCLRHEKRLNGRWIDQECWGLLRSEWKK